MASLPRQERFRFSLSSVALVLTMAMSPGAAFASPVSVQESMDDLWSQHMEWTYATVAAFASGSPDLPADMSRLLQNQQDIGNSMKAYYGDALGNELAGLLTTHINEAVPVLVAAQAGNTAALNTAVQAWYANATQIGNLLEAANPRWAKEGMPEMWRTHITQTIAYSVDLLHADPEQAIIDYDMARMHMMMMGQMLSDGLVGGMSTQLYPDLQTATINDTRYLRDTVLRRLNGTCTAQDSAQPGEEQCRPGFWIAPFGAWGHMSGEGDVANLSHDVSGVFMGADRTVADSWRVGVMGGYMRSRSKLDDFSSSATNEGYQLGFYAGTRWGAWHFNAGAAYSWFDVKADRQVIDLPGLHDSVGARYDMHAAQAFGELGRDLKFGAATVTPFVRAAYVDLHGDGFNESGDGAAVHADGSHDGIGFSTLGVRAHGLVYQRGDTSVSLRGLIGWEHALGGVTPDSTFTFSNNVRMTQTGVPVARDALDLEVGVDVAVGRKVRVGLDYVGQVGNHAVDNSAMAHVTVRF